MISALLLGGLALVILGCALAVAWVYRKGDRSRRDVP